jgi:hypothetical protein
MTVSQTGSDAQMTAVRQVYEGARPTLARLAQISKRLESELAALARAEGWHGLPEAGALRRRAALLTSQVLALLEEGDPAELLAKGKADALANMLKSIEKLRDFAETLETSEPPAADETDVRAAFNAIDQRISELAHAYAKRLVEEQSHAGAGGAGGTGVVPAGADRSGSAEG